MNAGRMTQRIDIQTATLGTAGTTGEQADSWSTIRRDVPAEVRYLGAAEQFRAKAVQSDATLLVTIRYDADVSAASRFVWGSKYLYPTSAVPDMQLRWISCLCREQL